jgi:hypothetical protein
MAIVDRFIIVPATPTIFIVLAILNPFLKNSELSPTYFRSGSPISYISFKDTRIIKLPDPTLFTRDYTVFNNWLVQIKNKL